MTSHTGQTGVSTETHSDTPRFFCRIDLILFLLVFCCYGYFHGGSLWNQNARFDAIMAYVEPGTPDSFSFRIDRFITDPVRGINTGDWSFYDGHYYANKAPGPILLGVPVYMAIFHFERILGIDPHGPIVEIVNLHLINLAVSCLLSALGIVFFKKLLLRLGTPKPDATIFAALLAFATALFPYNTQFWGHPTACAFIMIGLYFLTGDSSPALAKAGFFLGMAVLSDYLCGITVIAAGCFLLYKHPGKVRAYIAGGLPPLLLFMLYHYACFGSPFAVANNYINPIFVDDGHIFAMPSLILLIKLLFSPFRGLFLHTPVLLISIAGIARWSRRDKRDPLLWLCITNIILYLVINASFNGWHGGGTVCARYQIIAMPFWIICLKELPRTPKWIAPLALTAAVSIFNMLLVAAVSPCSPYARPEGPPEYYNPLYSWVYSSFFSGKLAAFKYSLSNTGNPRWNACNLGHVMGLEGITTLLPLTIFAGIIIFILLKTCREE